MSSEVLARFDLKRKLAEGMNDVICGLAKELEDQKNTFYTIVADYNRERLAFIKAELARRGQSWCTNCWRLVPETETAFVFTQGRERFSGGYERSEYGFRYFAFLYRACPACREKFMTKHGWHGQWDKSAQDQSSFSAFLVEKREGGYWASVSGLWEPLDVSKAKIPTPDDTKWEQIATDMCAPPRLEVKHKPGSLGNELIVHENASTPATT